MRISLGAVFVVAVLAGCAGTAPSPAATGAAGPTASVAASMEPSAAPSAAPTQAPTPVVTPEPAVLHRYGFARVVVAELDVRTAPSTSAPLLEEGGLEGQGPPVPVRYGTNYEVEDVFILGGPVEADGFEWWRVAPSEILSIAGWVASGNRRGTQEWLAPVVAPCPVPPIELADVTLTHSSWAVRLGCFRGQTLTFRGWLAWEFFDSSWEAVFPVQRTWSDPDSIDRLDYMLLPGAGSLPDTDQWIEIVGQFDHPLVAAQCEGASLLECRSTFAASSIRALGTQ